MPWALTAAAAQFASTLAFAPPPADPAPEPSSGRPYGAGTDAADPAEQAEADDDDDGGVRQVRVRSPRPGGTPGRAATRVTRTQLEERLPRSAPDALRGEPGVYVQQTAHSQGSPYVRGLTGQQTVMFFDGIRLNNSTFRQGPNQYFFTIDSRTIQSLDVVRGSASTRYGSDALGGALLTTPVSPDLTEGEGWHVHPRIMARGATADAEIGGRTQIEVSHDGDFGVMLGVGYRSVGQLRAGGRLTAPRTGEPMGVPPAFEEDEKTQRGTGFDEITSDARVVYRPGRRAQITLGYYDYRQLDAPRTDKCPPPTAPEDECLRYLQQFRTLGYARFDYVQGPRPAETITATLSYGNQHERRQLDRGSPSSTQVNGEDDVHTIGTSLRIATKNFAVAPWANLQGFYGADVYNDILQSEGWLRFTDVDIRSDLTRGQYLDGSNYLTSGVWTEGVATFAEIFRLRGGGRLAVADAYAPGDEATASQAVDRTWVTAVGSTGAGVQVVPWLGFVFNVDQGFRAPNLDDLTSRQQTGPGFQFENSELGPERSLNLETGIEIEHEWVELHAYGFQTTIRDLIGRAPRTVEQCPDGAEGCGASQTRFQLVNLEGRALIRGVDGDFRLYFPLGFRVRSTVSYAVGSTPNPVAEIDDAAGERVPMSRVPPLNGLVEAGWRSLRFGPYAFVVLRWARSQTRLAIADESDARIPLGGTPGFAVVDLRAGWRLDPHVLLSLVFENVGDVAYRHHGSSINGPGRGLIANLEFGW